MKMKTAKLTIVVFLLIALQTGHAKGNCLDMVLIPGGEFEMGDHFDEAHQNELPVHAVLVDAFFMSKYEITNSQYCDYLNDANPLGLIEVRGGVVYASPGGTDPYFNTHSYDTHSQIDYVSGTFSVRTKGDRDMSDDPMVEVSWYGCAAYCNWKSQQEGKEVCYNLSTWECDFSKHGYRLPTEAEWEYAARGGLSGKRFPWGDTINHDYANYTAYGSYWTYDTSPYTTQTPHPDWYDGIWPYTSVVGSFSANGYGLYDIVGNVTEWCNDWYGSYEICDPSPCDNPKGPASSSWGRVVRGGHWGTEAYGMRVTGRYFSYITPGQRTHATAFRVVRASEPAGPVAYWSFDDAGDPGHDDSGNGNNGTVYGAEPTDGICGGALSFDGIDDYVDMGTPPDFRITGALTATAWFLAEPEALINHPSVVQRSGWDVKNQWSWGLRLMYGAPQAWISESGSSFREATGQNVIESGAWHHLAMTYEPGTSIRVYLDGVIVEEAVTSVPGSINDPDGISVYVGACLGYIPPSSLFTGNIDEVRIYDRALSECEIKELAAPCKPAEPNIAVSPLSHDFGDVELGTSSTVVVTISNLGDGNLNVSGIALETDFAITSAPATAVVVEPNKTVDVEITYTPSALGHNSAVLKITSDDPDEPVVEVQLSATGVEIPPPPSEQIANILAFFDTSVNDGTLVGDGPGSSAEKRLNALRNMVEAAGSLIDDELSEEACQQLLDVYRRMDGQPSPPDFVKGEAVTELATMIQELMTTLGC